MANGTPHIVIPWKDVYKPFRLWGNIYFLGGSAASIHVVDTGDGLVLLDCGYVEQLYLLLDGMRQLGLDPSRIKAVLMTHAHIDHCSAAEALRQLYGCKLYINRRDEAAIRGLAEKDLTYAAEFNMNMIYFEPDGYFSDGDEMTFGYTTFRFFGTPGHTAGTTTILFDAVEGSRTLRAAIHGGSGMNTLTRGYLRNHNQPMSLRDEFVDANLRLAEEHVDIHLGNHTWQNQTATRMARLAEGESDAFVDPDQWRPFCLSCIESLNKQIAKEAAADAAKAAEEAGK